MTNLLTLKFWFSSRPGDLSVQGQLIWLVLIVVLVAISLYAWWWRKQNTKSLYRKIYGRVMTFGLTNLFVGLLLWFFEYEAVPILSMRMWLLVWLASMAAWKWFIWKDIQKISNIQVQIAEDKKLKKYIP